MISIYLGPSTFQVLCSILRKWADNRHSPHLQGAFIFNLVYFVSFKIFYYLWSARSNSLTWHILSMSYSPASPLITLRYYTTSPTCTVPFLTTAVFLFIVCPVWNTLPGSMYSSLSTPFKCYPHHEIFPDSPELGASKASPIILCAYPNHGTSHYLFTCLSPSLDWKLLRGRACVFFNLSILRSYCCIWYIDDE